MWKGIRSWNKKGHSEADWRIGDDLLPAGSGRSTIWKGLDQVAEGDPEAARECLGQLLRQQIRKYACLTKYDFSSQQPNLMLKLELFRA